MAGAPLLDAATDFAAIDVCPISRRVYATAAHSRGAAAGPPLSLPVPNQASTPAPTPRTLTATARGAAVITGADTAAGADNDVSDEPSRASTNSLPPAGTSAGAEGPEDTCEGVPSSGVLTSAVGGSTVSAR
jgi:hypothetical protein